MKRIAMFLTMAAGIASAQLWPTQQPATSAPPVFRPMVLTPMPMPAPLAMPAPPVYTPPVRATQTQIGDSVYYRDSTGTTGTSNRIGDTTYTTYRNGGETTRCTANQIGGTVYSNCR